MPPRPWSPARVVAFLSALAVPVAILRYFARGLLEPRGVPVAAGSFLASLTLVLVAGVAWLFGAQGRRTGGGYRRAAGWYLVLAAWCEVLIVAGILASEATGADTYYRGPWAAVERRFPTAAAHAIGHAQGFLPRLAIGLALGGIVYAVAKRRRAPLHS